MLDLYSRWRSKFDRSELDEEDLFAFDCDQTLISGDIGEATLRRAVERRWVISHDEWWSHLSQGVSSVDEVNRWRFHYENEAQTKLTHPSKELSNELWEAYIKLCEIDVSSAYIYAARLAFQKSSVELSLLAQDALIHDPKVSLRPQMKAFTTELNRNGGVWVVSSSHIDIVRVIAYHYGIDTRQVIGIDFERDSRSQVYTDRLITPAPISDKKVDALALYTRQIPALMVGDSRHDLPMMSYCETSIFIDHHSNAKLTESAERLGALILSADTVSV